ncbi:peroxiredoxin [Candidatus Acidianus copahuensis]|uniref:Peroxiredoxin n=1 Tax=Candidatus Acidianus copahuensis TaxID=1160895 RepID=A0A031LN41_9CREN|nr:DsrE family protein [Candidatus Acidianus copahuensis]EZQ07068.1 peroxiredoxin [Candidatus Acidianus copahuensis]
MPDYAFFIISGEREKLYMAFITAIGYVSAGSKIYMFFTMDGLNGITKKGLEEIKLENVKPLKYYVDNLIELGENDIELAACEFGMKVKGIGEEDLIQGVKVSGVSEFAYKSSTAKSILVF